MQAVRLKDVARVRASALLPAFWPSSRRTTQRSRWRSFQAHDAKGRLVRVPSNWCAPFSGDHLCDPSRRQPSPTFSLLVDTLRYRG
jgi:hypothetical protein